MKHTPERVLTVHLQAAAAFQDRVNAAFIEKAVRMALDTAGREFHGEMSIVITDDTHVKRLNRVYRGVDVATDVLAFGEGEETGVLISSPELAPYLGDVVISFPRAVEQAAERGHPTEDELSVLVVHGVLHLLGYDHGDKDEREEMWHVQDAALHQLGIRTQT